MKEYIITNIKILNKKITCDQNGYLVIADSEKFGKQEILFESPFYSECAEYVKKHQKYDLEDITTKGETKEIIERIIEYGLTTDAETLLNSKYENLSKGEMNKAFEEDYEEFLKELGIRNKSEIKHEIQELKEELWDENEDEAEIEEIEDKLSVLDDELLFWAD